MKQNTHKRSNYAATAVRLVKGVPFAGIVSALLAAFALQTASADIVFTGDAYEEPPMGWFASNSVVVGNSTSGSLTVNGGSYLDSWISQVGINAPGTATVSNATWNAGTLYVGFYNAAGSVSVTNSGTLQASANIGSNSNATLSLNGSTFKTDNTSIGSSGTLVALNSSIERVGAGLDAPPGSLTIGGAWGAGTGTANLTNTSLNNVELSIGEGGKGVVNMMNVTSWNSRPLLIGGNGTLNSTGSYMSCGGQVTIGSTAGGNATVNLAGASYFTAYSDTILQDRGVLNISGNSSYSTSNGNLTISDATLNLSGNSTLSVEKSYGFGYELGGNIQIGGGNGTLAISGNSRLNVSANLTIGSDGYYGGNGTLSLSSGTVNATGLSVVGYSPTKGSINMSGGNFTFGSADIQGSVSVSNGTFGVKGYSDLYLNNGGCLTLSGGNVSANAMYLRGFGVENSVANISGGNFSADRVQVGTVHDPFNPWLTSCGTINISGGNFESTGINGVEVVEGDVNVSGGNVSAWLQIGTSRNGTLNVSGGTVSGPVTVGTFGNGTATISGGTVSGDIWVGFYGGSTGTLNIGNGTSAGTIQSGTINGGGGTAVVNLNHTGQAAVGSNLTGNLSLQKYGTGTTTLSGNNTFDGATGIHAGTLLASGTGALYGGDSSKWNSSNITVHSGATLALSVGGAGRFSAANATTLLSNAGFQSGSSVGFDTTHASGGFTLADGISGSIGLAKLGSNTLLLTGNSTYSAATKIEGGTLEIGAGGRLGGGTYAGAISNNGTLAYSGSSDQTLSGAVTGTGGLVKNGNATLTLSNASNSYTGGTTINGGAIAFGSNQTLRSLAGSGNIALANRTLTAENAAGSSTYSGSITGSGSLAKTGNGTLTLGGSSTYLGQTTVSAGTLAVTGSVNNSTATVQSGATLTGGGSVGGLILNSGAKLSPGNSPGTLTVLGNATWNGGANLNWQVLSTNTNPSIQTAAGTGWDFVDIGGTLTLGVSTSNKFNLNLWSLSSTGPDVNGTIPGWDPAVGSTWLIASADGGIYLDGSALALNSNYSSYFNINTSATGGAGGWSGALPASFQIISLGNANNLYLQALANGAAAVPEPGQVAASLLLLGGIGGYVWIKRRRGAKGKAGATGA